MPADATWYLAVCLGCTPLLPQPFSGSAARNTWASGHRQATGHTVAIIDQHVIANMAAAPPGWTYLGRADPGSPGGGGYLFAAPLGTPAPELGALAAALGLGE